MITVASLKDHSRKDLAQMAKKLGIAGWHSMRKDQLIRCLARRAAKKTTSASRTSAKSSVRTAAASASGRSSGKSSQAAASRSSSADRGAVSTKRSRKIRQVHETRLRRREICTDDVKNGSRGKDRVVLMVRDAYWLQVCWDVTRQSIVRAKAAMAEQWHTAKPTLRLIQVETGTTTSAAERPVRDIEIHGGVKNWYIDVYEPPKSFRVDLGYRATDGRFHTLCRSNVITTPEPGSCDALDENWRDVAENYERIFALSGGYSDTSGATELQELFEERLRRPMQANAAGRFGNGAERLMGRHQPFALEVDAEMVVFGRTKSDARVTLCGEPVKLRDDGSFTVRLKLPDRRQVLPVVASSSDGVEQRTTVLAVERNTKIMEPVTAENPE